MSNISIPFRFAFFILVIPIAFALSVWLRYWLIVISVVVGLLIANFFEQVNQLLERHPKIRDARPLGKALGLTLDMREFYRDSKPAWFIFYIFYPVAAPIAAIFNKARRAELKLWGKTFLVLTSGTLINVATTYPSTYPPYLGISDAIGIAISHVVFGLILSIACLMPVMTTAFNLSLAGRGKSLGVLSAVSLLLCVGISALFIQVTRDQITPVSAGLLRRRMAQPEFRHDIGVTSEIILAYLQARSTAPLRAAIRDGVVVLDAATVCKLTPCGKKVSTGPTEKFRDMVKTAAPNDEPRVFDVVAIRSQPSGGQVWCGIQYRSSNRVDLLYLMDEQGHISNKWSALPAPVQKRLGEAYKHALRGSALTFSQKMAEDR